LNGKSLGIQKPDATHISTNLANPPFTFNMNTFEKGELVAKAYIKGKEVISDTVRSPGNPTAIEMQVDYSGKSAKSNSNDVLFVYAKVVDKNGTVVTQKNFNIQFSIEGDAQLVSPNNITTEAGIAAALVRIGKNQKPVLIKAKFNKIEAEINITVEKNQLK